MSFIIRWIEIGPLLSELLIPITFSDKIQQLQQHKVVEVAEYLMHLIVRFSEGKNLISQFRGKIEC